MPHFIVGAQKKMVFGPAGWFQNDLALAAKDMASQSVAECLRVCWSQVLLYISSNIISEHLHRVVVIASRV
jgi:hypothetical protein